MIAILLASGLLAGIASSQQQADICPGSGACIVELEESLFACAAGASLPDKGFLDALKDVTDGLVEGCDVFDIGTLIVVFDPNAMESWEPIAEGGVLVLEVADLRDGTDFDTVESALRLTLRDWVKGRVVANTE